jgi:hypothetical protein
MSEPSHALVPVESSNAIVPVTNDQNQAERQNKRNRIEYEHANAALETPSTYDDALKSVDSKMWKDAIDVELKALQEKKTWSMLNGSQP